MQPALGATSARFDAEGDPFLREMKSCVRKTNTEDCDSVRQQLTEVDNHDVDVRLVCVQAEGTDLKQSETWEDYGGSSRGGNHIPHACEEHGVGGGDNG